MTDYTLTDHEVKKIIDLGSIICANIKRTYYPKVAWEKCRGDITNKFTLLKKITRPMYDVDDIRLLEILLNFSAQDLRDVLDGIQD